MLLTQQTISIRWLIKRDMEEVLAIEQACFHTPWSEDNFIMALRSRNTIGMIAESSEKVLGFVIYDLLKEKLQLLNFAVAPQYHRCKVGTQLVDKLKLKLSPVFRKKIYLATRESNLPAQLFFKSQGFRAYKVLDNYYDNDEAAYCFKFKLDKE